MHIEDLLRAASASTRRVKEAIVEDGPNEIHPMIEVWRGEDPIALVTLADHDRREILGTASAAVAGFDADSLAVSFEGYAGVGTAFTDANINPMTGKRWRDQEMQYVVENHDGIAKNWVTETMQVTVVNRAGDLAMMTQWFRYTPEGVLVWGKARDMNTMNPDSKVGGRMPDTLVKMMLAPSGATVFPYGEESISRTVRDAEVAQLLSTNKCAVALWSNINDAERVGLISQIGIIIK